MSEPIPPAPVSHPGDEIAAPFGASYDSFDILSSIWVLSCNDETAIMTYRGINDRLMLPEGYDAKTLIGRRRELFRPGAPDWMLETWKTGLQTGTNKLPDWIERIENKADRIKVIEGLGKKDVFINQFRVAGRDQDKARELAHIDWGLQHIERLRKSAADAKEQRLKRVSLIFIPAISILIAIISVLASTYMQFKTTQIQNDLKRYEVDFKPKQEGYLAFMTSLLAAFDAGRARDGSRLLAGLDRMEAAFYILEPFLGAEGRTELWKKLQEFGAFSQKLAADTSPTPPGSARGADRSAEEFVQFRNYFRAFLYSMLFSVETGRRDGPRQ